MVGDMEKILDINNEKALISKLQKVLEHTLLALKEGSCVDTDVLFFELFNFDQKSFKIEMFSIVYSFIDAILDAREHGFEYLFNQPKLGMKYSISISLLYELADLFAATKIRNFDDVYNHSVYKLVKKAVE